MINNNKLILNMSKKKLRIVILGPTGNGKSQLCNFILQDKSNKKFNVSSKIYSETKNTISDSIFRSGKIIEVIDTPGFDDSDNQDLDNSRNLINFIKKQGKIDFILFILNFSSRKLKGSEKIYFDNLSKVFTKNKFISHLGIIYTNYFGRLKDERIKNNVKKELIEFINNEYNIENNIENPFIYFFDTDPEGENYDNYQIVFNEIINKIEKKIAKYGEINSSEIKEDQSSNFKSIQDFKRDYYENQKRIINLNSQLNTNNDRINKASNHSCFQV